MEIVNSLRTHFILGWNQVALSYQAQLLSIVKVAFEALKEWTTALGSYTILGGLSIGLVYMGHSVWTMKFEVYKNNILIESSGPKSAATQKLLRLAGLIVLWSGAILAGGLCAIGLGSAPVGLASTLTIGLLGTCV